MARRTARIGAAVVAVLLQSAAAAVTTPGRVAISALRSRMPVAVTHAFADSSIEGVNGERTFAVPMYMGQHALDLCVRRNAADAAYTLNGTFAVQVVISDERSTVGAMRLALHLPDVTLAAGTQSGAANTTEGVAAVEYARVLPQANKTAVILRWASGQGGERCLRWARDDWASTPRRQAGQGAPAPPAEHVQLALELANDAGAMYAASFDEYKAHEPSWLQDGVRRAKVVLAANPVPKVSVLSHAALSQQEESTSLPTYGGLKFAEDAPHVVFGLLRECLPGLRADGQDRGLLEGLFNYTLSATGPVSNFSAIPAARTTHTVLHKGRQARAGGGDPASQPGTSAAAYWEGSECGAAESVLVTYRFFEACVATPTACGANANSEPYLLAKDSAAAQPGRLAPPPVASRFALAAAADKTAGSVEAASPADQFDVRIDDKPAQGSAGEQEDETTAVDLATAFADPAYTDGKLTFLVGVRGQTDAHARKMLTIVSVSDTCFEPADAQGNYRFDSAQLAAGAYCSNLPLDFETSATWLGVDMGDKSPAQASTALLHAVEGAPYPAESVYTSGPAQWNNRLYPHNPASTVGLDKNRGSNNMQTTFSNAGFAAVPTAYYQVSASIANLTACRAQADPARPVVLARNRASDIQYTVPVAVTLLAADPTGRWAPLACTRTRYRLATANSYSLAARLGASESQDEGEGIELGRVEVQLGTPEQCAAANTTAAAPVPGSPGRSVRGLEPVGMPRPYSFDCSRAAGAIARLRITLFSRVRVQRSAESGDAGVLPPTFLPRADGPALDEAHWPAALRPGTDICHGMNRSTAAASMATAFLGQTTIDGVQYNSFSLTYSTAYQPFSGDDGATLKPDVFAQCAAAGKASSRFDVVVPFFRYNRPNGAWDTALAQGLPSHFVPFQTVRVAVSLTPRFDPREFSVINQLPDTVLHQVYKQPLGDDLDSIERAELVNASASLTRGERLGIAFALPADQADVADMFVRDVDVAVLSHDATHRTCVTQGTSCGDNFKSLASVCDRDLWRAALAQHGESDARNPIERTYRFISNFEPAASAPWQTHGLSPRVGVNLTTSSCRYDLNPNKAAPGTPNYFCGAGGTGAPRCSGDPYSRMEDGGVFGYTPFADPSKARRSQDAIFLSTWGLDVERPIVACVRIYWYMCSNRAPGGRRLLSAPGGSGGSFSFVTAIRGAGAGVGGVVSADAPREAPRLSSVDSEPAWGAAADSKGIVAIQLSAEVLQRPGAEEREEESGAWTAAEVAVAATVAAGGVAAVAAAAWAVKAKLLAKGAYAKVVALEGVGPA